MESTKMELDEYIDKEKTAKKVKTDGLSTLVDQIKEIERGVARKDPKIIQKVISRLLTTRKELTEENLSQLLEEFHSDNDDLNLWINYQPKRLNDRKQSRLEDVPEIDAYINLLILLKLIDSGRYSDALECSDKLMEKLFSNFPRTVEPIAAKCFFYYSRVYELNGKLDEIRNILFSTYRKCVLKNDSASQAVLINCILRNYLTYNLYECADKFVGKVQFPDQAANNEWSRYLYYLARIKATRLKYSEAQEHVNLALRKAPDTTALGFRQAANKLAVCIYLLLGEIPYKKVFTQSNMQISLQPYFHLTRAVRNGDLVYFNEILDTYGNSFHQDSTFNLILRLRRNVIRRAIRGIGLSYSRISPAQVARKLGLDSPEEALYIIVKAIKDGVLEASLYHNHKYLVSHEESDLYKSLSPSTAYQKLINACLELHNFSVKSMRYPMKKYESKLDDSGGQDDLDDDFDELFL